MAVFQGARQATRENLAIATGYGILDRDFRKKLGMKVPKFKALSVFRLIKGKMEPQKKVKNHQYYFYEEGDWFNAAATIAVRTNTGSTDVDITISTADHYDTGSKSFPRVGNLVVFSNETVGYVYSATRTTPNAHVFVIKAYNAAQDVRTAAVVGGTVTFYGDINPEKSTEVETLVPYVSKVTNRIHVTREKYEVTDFAAQHETEFEYEGKSYLYVKGIDETADRLAMKEELNLILTPASDGTLADAAGNTLNGATGMFPQITSSGQTFEHDGDFTKADFDDLVLTVDDNYGDDEYMVGRGRNLSISMENWLIDFTKNGDNAISFNWFDGGKKQAVSFDFVSAYIGGISWHLTTWPLLSHAGSLGAGVQPWRHQGCFIPCGNTKDPDNGGAQVPYLQLHYSPPQGSASAVQGDLKVWETGADARPNPTNDEETREIHMITYKSLCMRNREKFIRAILAA
jgi:hypothetical protein